MIGGETTVERYELLGEIATGGMATVYFGRQRGAFGFSRTVAIKSMHPQLAKDPGFRAMFVDEANLTSRIRHPNVVPTLDIVSSPTKLLIVMEYVEGVSLSVLLRAAKQHDKKIPIPVVVAVVRDLLEGLQAAHDLRDDRGQPLSVVHRDVSPQNVLVGADGIARVVDFGVAKAAGRSYHTQTGEIRGKVGYMAPEQMFGEDLDRRVDVYATGVVLWESLACDRLFSAPTDAALVLLVMQGTIKPAGVARGEPLPSGLEALIMRALAHEPNQRFSSANEMLAELLRCGQPASREEVGRIVRELCPEEITHRASLLRQSSPSIQEIDLEPEARGVLEVLTRATMSRDMLTGPTAPASSRRGWLPIVFGLGALVTLSGITTATLLRRPRSPTTIGPAPTTSIEPAIGSASPPPSTETTTPAPSDSASGVASPNDPPLGSAAKPRHVGRRVKPPASAPPAVTPAGPATKPGCAVPYVTDAEGHRHYKKECIE